MEQLDFYILLLGIISIICILFRKVSVPISIILVIAGMFISLLPYFPPITLESKLVLDIFLPLLIYHISAETSWRDVKLHFRPILLLSVGHVLIISILVAIVIHALIPELGWPLAFVLGAVVSPPDDVAIVPIAEKLKMPRRIITILKGEGMFNDATALILFRFSLAAAATHEFEFTSALSNFLIIVTAETLYGMFLGYLIGEIRIRIEDPKLHMIISVLTPFLAYLPAEKLGGSGILATVITGLIIGHKYLEKFKAEVRLISHSVWTILEYMIENILFLLVGLNLRFIIVNISTVPIASLTLYATSVIGVVIIGRFLCVYLYSYFSRFMSSRKNKFPWRNSFIVSWAGLRGGVSLAAAFAMPLLTPFEDGTNPRDLIIFLVFCVVAATLIVQGLSLPLILKLLDVPFYGQREKHDEELVELWAKLKITMNVIRWLSQYQHSVKKNEALLEEVQEQIQKYQLAKNQLRMRIKNHNSSLVPHEKKSVEDKAVLASQLIEIERDVLLRLWNKEKINHTVKNRILSQLDHRDKQMQE